jgi:hypothetical protein
MPPRKKEKAPPEPDDLVRVSAGAYTSGDGRFQVEKSDVGWYLVDAQQTNEFGQQLIHGPFPTLESVRDAIPGTREIKPLLRVRPRKSSSKASTASDAPPPPPTWIDRLPDKEAAGVRRLIKALEQEKIPDAEELVKRQRDENSSLIATRVIEHRLRTMIDGLPENERDSARAISKRIVDLLAGEGGSNQRPLPRWALVEADRDDSPPPIHPRV